jgi:hypothetical protein
LGKIECFQPTSLNGGREVSPKDIENIVQKTMKKAKRQLSRATPGILAICGFNQSKTVIDNLKKSLTHRLAKTDRSDLCGVLLAMLGILFRRSKQGMQFTSTITIDFVSNPSYFGRVDIISDAATNDPTVVREPVTEVKTDDLISGNPIPRDVTQIAGTSESEKQNPIINIKEEKLRVIEAPAKSSRVVFDYQDTQPKIKGEGNINYLCGSCGALLVERAWKQSLSNIVLRCPSCQLYNEFDKINIPAKGIVGTIAFKEGEYHLTEVVKLKRGVCCFGL